MLFYLMLLYLCENVANMTLVFDLIEVTGPRSLACLHAVALRSRFHTEALIRFVQHAVQRLLRCPHPKCCRFKVVLTQELVQMAVCSCKCTVLTADSARDTDGLMSEHICRLPMQMLCRYLPQVSPDPYTMQTQALQTTCPGSGTDSSYMRRMTDTRNWCRRMNVCEYSMEGTTGYHSTQD